MFGVGSKSASNIWSGTLLLTGCWTGNNSMLVEVALLSLSLSPMNLAEEMGNSSLAVNNHAALSLSLSRGRAQKLFLSTKRILGCGWRLFRDDSACNNMRGDLKWICNFISAFRDCHQFEFCFNLEYAINFDYVSFFGDNAAAHNKGRNERNVGWYSMWQSNNNTEVGSFFTCFPLPRRLTSLETDIIASGKER